MIEKISKDIDYIDIGWNIDISISKMLMSIYHIKNVDTTAKKKAGEPAIFGAAPGSQKVGAELELKSRTWERSQRAG